MIAIVVDSEQLVYVYSEKRMTTDGPYLVGAENVEGLEIFG